MDKNQLRFYSQVTMGLNLVVFFFGVLYFLSVYFLPSVSLPIGNLFGFIMIFTWLVNLGLIFVDDRVVNKSNPVGEKINKVGLYFLIFFILATFFFLGNNLLLSITISTSKSAMIKPLILALVGLFGISGFGAFLGWFNFDNLDNQEVWKF